MDLLRSIPIGLHLEEPITWLHQLDPRVKLAWLMSFLLTPVLSSSLWRVILVVILVFLTLTARIPWRVWKQQMVWLLFFGTLAFVITCIVDDGLAIRYQPRVPESDFQTPITAYNYILFQLGNIQVSRQSFDLGIRLGSIIFTLIYSTTLYLLTTAPEEITASIENLIKPLERFNVPVVEITLTLTLSLRFIPLVLEEIQNLTRSIYTRAISWKKIGLQQSAKIWLVVAERLLENLLMRAEQIAIAMNVRGFTSPNEHRVQWYQFRLGKKDGLALGILVILWWARFTWGSMN